MHDIEHFRCLFSPHPARASLSVPISSTSQASPLEIAVWRNHTIEPILTLAQPYAAWIGWAPHFWLSGYDDALTFAEQPPPNAAAEIFWLDPHRIQLHGSERAAWLANRLLARRAQSHAPFLVLSWAKEGENWALFENALSSVPDCLGVNLAAVAQEHDWPLLDSRLLELAATPINARLHASIARALVCRWLAGALATPIKLIATDLDGTLHQGVLGEVGIEGITVTPRHLALQQRLAALSQQGVLLSLITKNDPRDVEALLNSHPDYFLRKHHFAVIHANWNEKSHSLAEILRQMRIGFDAALFIDDNWGELASIQARLPRVQLLPIFPDLEITLTALDNWPGLYRWRRDEAARIRANDLAAQIRRDELTASTSDHAQLYRELEVTLTYLRAPHEHLARLADLSARTNQFNATLRRTPLAELVAATRGADQALIGAHLKDRLSDAGIIAFLFAKRCATGWQTQELCISCRALGRGLEDAIILGMAIRLTWHDQDQGLVIPFTQGPRNEPALRWLSQWGDPKSGSVFIPKEIIKTFSTPDGVMVKEG